MKKLLLTSLLGFGLLLPANFSASTTTSSTQKKFLQKNPEKVKAELIERVSQTDLILLQNPIHEAKDVRITGRNCS